MTKSDVTGLDLKIARVIAGVKQYEVAFLVGIKPPRLSEIESGRRPLDYRLAQQIETAISSAAKGYGPGLNGSTRPADKGRLP